MPRYSGETRVREKYIILEEFEDHELSCSYQLIFLNSQLAPKSSH